MVVLHGDWSCLSCGKRNFARRGHMVVKNNQMMNQTMRVKTIFLIMRTKSWLIAPLRSEFGGRR